MTPWTADRGGSDAFDFCAHGDEQSGKVGDFRLLRAVFHHGFAIGEDCGHEQIFSAGDGDLVKDEMRTMETRSAGFEIAMLLHDGGTHFFEAA